MADKDDYLFGIKFDGVENLVETMTKEKPGKGTPSKGKKIAYTKASPDKKKKSTPVKNTTKVTSPQKPTTEENTPNKNTTPVTTPNKDTPNKKSTPNRRSTTIDQDIIFVSSKEAESAGSDLMETDYHSFYDEQEPLLEAEAPAVHVVPNQTREHVGENFNAPIDIDWDTAGVRAPGIRDEPNAAMDEDAVEDLLGIGVGCPEEVLNSDVDDDNDDEQEEEEEEE